MSCIEIKLDIIWVFTARYLGLQKEKTTFMGVEFCFSTLSFSVFRDSQHIALGIRCQRCYVTKAEVGKQKQAFPNTMVPKVGAAALWGVLHFQAYEK